MASVARAGGGAGKKAPRRAAKRLRGGTAHVGAGAKRRTTHHAGGASRPMTLGGTRISRGARTRPSDRASKLRRPRRGPHAHKRTTKIRRAVQAPHVNEASVSSLAVAP